MRRIKRSSLITMALTIFLLLISCLVTLADPDAAYIPQFRTVSWLFSFTAGVLMLFSGKMETLNQKMIVIAAWFIRVSYATGNNTIGFFGGDPFYEMGYAVYYHHPDSIIADTYYPVITNYPPILNVEMHFFGPNRILLCYFSCFLSMIGILFVLKSLALLGIDDRTKTVILLLLSWNLPSILVDCEIFRESIEFPLAAISFYWMVKWIRCEKNAKDAIIAIAFTAPIVWLHTFYFTLTVAYGVFLLFHFNGVTVQRMVYKMLLAVVGVVGAFFVLRSAIYGGALSSTQIDTVLSSVGDYFNGIQILGGIIGDANSLYLGWMRFPNSKLLVLVYTIIRIIYFLVSPMIWSLNSIGMIALFFLDSLTFVLCAVFLIRILYRKGGIRKLKHQYKEYYYVIISALLAIVAVSVPFCWGTVTAGTAMRHRNVLLPLVCVVIGICMNMLKTKHTVGNSLEE